MLKKSVLAFFGTLLLYASAYAQPDKTIRYCAYTEGQVIEPKTISYVWNNVNPNNLEKGEFETTFDFNKRVDESKKLSRFPFPIKVQDISHHLKYDADRQFFQFKPNFVIKSNVYFSRKMDEMRSENKDANIAWHYHAFEIAREFNYNPKRLTKINKSGEAIKVEDHETKYVHIYDRSKEKSHTPMFQPDENSVSYIPVPLSKAPQFRREMKVYLFIQPRSPYTQWLEYFEAADIDSGEDYISNVNAKLPVIFADVTCMGITDRNNKIIKIVKSYKPPLQHSANVLHNQMQEALSE